MIRHKIKEVMLARGISQRQLFLLTGIDIKHIQRLVRDPTRDTKISTLNKIAKALDITDISDLLEIIPDDNTKWYSIYHFYENFDQSLDETCWNIVVFLHGEYNSRYPLLKFWTWGTVRKDFEVTMQPQTVTDLDTGISIVEKEDHVEVTGLEKFLPPNLIQSLQTLLEIRRYGLKVDLFVSASEA